MKFYGDYQVYSESGVDLTLLRENLRRSETDRARANIAAAKSLWGVRPAWRKAHRETLILEAAHICEQLQKNQVEYVILGTLAMAIHGSAYVTESFDLCYQCAEANVAALVRALKPFTPASTLDEQFLRKQGNLAVTTELGDISLLGEVCGLGAYEEVLSHSVERVLFDLRVRVLGLDGLIAAKKASGTIGDNLHVLELEELKTMSDLQRA